MEEGGEEAGELIGALSIIAVPLAEKKLQKKLYKVVKRAAASKILRRGVKEVVKVLRKADKFKGSVFSSSSSASSSSFSSVLCIWHLGVHCFRCVRTNSR